MFQRPTTSKSSFPSMRPHYVRSLEPCLPQVLSNGSFADSAVVKWLRPQLRACATERLGPSFLLQSECETSSSPDEGCNLPKRPFDYRQVVCASPWAKREDCHADAAEGKLRPPRPSGVHHVLRLQRSFGAGEPRRAPSKEPGICASDASGSCFSNPSCALELLCAAGMQNFSRLLDARTQSLDSSLDLLDSLAVCWKVAEPHLQRLLRVERREVDHECDACVAVLLGAYVDPEFLSAGLSTDVAANTTRQSFWNWWWCVVAFLHRSQIRLFASGSVAPFDMLLFLTEKLLPAEKRHGPQAKSTDKHEQSNEPSVRPGIDAFSTADALDQLASVDRPFAVNEPASKCLGCLGYVEPGWGSAGGLKNMRCCFGCLRIRSCKRKDAAPWRCQMGLAVRHLLDALQDREKTQRALHTVTRKNATVVPVYKDARWASGHVFAAQHYLAHCDLLELAHPMSAYVWHLFASVGRRCMNTRYVQHPTPPECGSRFRLVRRFRAKSPHKLAPRIQRTSVHPTTKILSSLM